MLSTFRGHPQEEGLRGRGEPRTRLYICLRHLNAYTPISVHLYSTAKRYTVCCKELHVMSSISTGIVLSTASGLLRRECVRHWRINKNAVFPTLTKRSLITRAAHLQGV
jgi:hypothetical protein